MADLDEAVSAARQAVAEGGRRVRVPGTALRSLSQALALRYDRFGDRGELDEALAALERAADATVDELERAGLRFDLAALHNNRYVDTRAPADARVAVESPGASVHRRIEALSNAAKLLAELGEWDEATNLVAHAMDLLPTLVGRHLSVEDRASGLGEFAFLPILGGSYAIAASRPEQALELLEWSRNLLFSEDTAIRDGLDELARRAPDLAEALRRLTTEVATTTDAERRHRVDRERRGRRADPGRRGVRRLPQATEDRRPPRHVPGRPGRGKSAACVRLTPARRAPGGWRSAGSRERELTRRLLAMSECSSFRTISIGRLASVVP